MECTINNDNGPAFVITTFAGHASIDETQLIREFEKWKRGIKELDKFTIFLENWVLRRPYFLFQFLSRFLPKHIVARHVETLVFHNAYIKDITTEGEVNTVDLGFELLERRKTRVRR